MNSELVLPILQTAQQEFVYHFVYFAILGLHLIDFNKRVEDFVNGFHIFQVTKRVTAHRPSSDLDELLNH